ncbi:MAG TPA: hypothetical protein VFZ14_04830, partial [Burkholderiales bacterium]|nr:hypothetical protein [Burkholderiales bacterium]
IQTYKRAHAADMRHKSKAEIEAAQGPHRKEGEKNGECCREVHQEFGDGHGCCSAERSETSCEAGFKPLASIEKMVKKTAKKTTGKPTAKRTAKKAGKK